MTGLVGGAFVAIWHDIVPEGKAEFYAWHTRQHMPERLSVAGFLRGRRYLAERGAPEYFNLYEVQTADVLTGKILGRLNNPAVDPAHASHFRNVSRSLCRVGASLTQPGWRNPDRARGSDTWAGGRLRASWMTPYWAFDQPG
jgi:hypothetical protein